LKEIEIINPEYIVTLGNVPLRSVYGDFSISIGEVHGTLTRVEVLGTEFNLFPLYHPASIIYNVKLKEIYNEDLNKLRMPQYPKDTIIKFKPEVTTDKLMMILSDSFGPICHKAQLGTHQP